MHAHVDHFLCLGKVGTGGEWAAPSSPAALVPGNVGTATWSHSSITDEDHVPVLLKWCEKFGNAVDFIDAGKRKSFQVPLDNIVYPRVSTNPNTCFKAWPGELSMLFFPLWVETHAAVLNKLVVMSPICIWTCCLLHWLQQPKKLSSDTCTSW